MKRNRTTTLPDGCIIVRTYPEFAERILQFVQRKLTLLLIIGDPGISKSQIVHRAVQAVDHLYLETHATALGMYQRLYKNQNKPVVIDDIDSIYADKAAVRLLKSLCNTDKVKTLRWDSNHSTIGDGEDQTPREFSTTSPVCLIANQWETANVNVRAIQDRAIVLHFDPSPLEVHRQVGLWFRDREVYEFIGSNLHLIAKPSMRLYVKASQLRQAGSSRWKDDVLTMAGVDDKTRIIAELLADTTLTENERAKTFEERTGCARSTYFERKRKLPPQITVDPAPTIIVRFGDSHVDGLTPATTGPVSWPEQSGGPTVHLSDGQPDERAEDAA